MEIWGNLSRRTRGIIIGSISALSFATYVLINRYVYTQQNIEVSVYLVTFFVSGGILAALSLLFKKHKGLVRVPRKDFIPVIANGLLTAIGLGIFVYGQSKTTAVNAAIIATSTTLTTIIYSRFLLKESLSRLQIFWMVVLFAGLYVAIVGLEGIELSRGDIIVFSSALFLGFTNTYSKTLMKRVSSSYIADTRVLVGGVFFLILGLVFNEELFTTQAGLWPMVSGLVFWLTVTCFYKTVDILNPTEAIVVVNSQSIITPFLGFLLLSEPYGLNQLAGGVLILYSIYRISSEAKRRETAKLVTPD